MKKASSRYDRNEAFLIYKNTNATSLIDSQSKLVAI